MILCNFSPVLFSQEKIASHESHDGSRNSAAESADLKHTPRNHCNIAIERGETKTDVHIKYKGL